MLLPRAAGAVRRPPLPAGPRAAFEMRSSMAISSQFAISEEPPAERNGVVWPVSGISPVMPPRMTKTCKPSVKARPPATSLPNESRTASAGPQAALDDQQVDHQQRGEAEQADLLAHAGEDEVGAHLGHETGRAGARPGAEQAAGAQREQALDQLVAAADPVVVGRVERVQPDRGAVVEVGERAADRRARAGRPRRRRRRTAAGR